MHILICSSELTGYETYSGPYETRAEALLAASEEAGRAMDSELVFRVATLQPAG
jgi:hypothetical protein